MLAQIDIELDGIAAIDADADVKDLVLFIEGDAADIGDGTVERDLQEACGLDIGHADGHALPGFADLIGGDLMQDRQRRSLPELRRRSHPVDVVIEIKGAEQIRMAVA